MRGLRYIAPLACLTACAALIGIEQTHEDSTNGGDSGPGGPDAADEELVGDIDAGETRDAEDESTEQDLDGGAPGSDASPDAIAPPTCNLAMPFGAPKPYTELNTSAWETGSHLSPDELTVWFQRRSSATSNDGEIYIATRTDKALAFGTPKKVTELNSSVAEGAPSVRGDGLLLFMGSDRSGSDGLDIWKSSRGSTASAWATPVNAGNINTSYGEDDPFLLQDGRALYWDSRRGQAGNIYRASVDSFGNTGSAVTVGTTINTDAKESEPVVTLDELTIYFARTGSTKAIYVAKRTSATGAWGSSSAVSELNSSADENPDWISADGCHITFSSDRSGGKGLYDLYHAEKP